MAMCSDKRKVLQENFTYFMDNIVDISTVVSHLFSANVITSNMKEDIMSKDTRRKQLYELLTILPMRGEAAFDKFYKALIDSGEDVAAKIMEPHVSDRSLIVTKQEDNPEQVVHSTVNRDELPAVFPDPGDDSTIVNVQKCMSVNGDHIYDKYIGCVNGQCPEVYQMTTLTRGYCVVINNEKFLPGKELDYREGSDKDVESLKKLFEQLSFRFEDYQDKTAKEIRDIVKVYQQCDHSQYNCFVLVILSHGSHGNIYGVDGEEVKISELVFSFESEGCKSLSGKPKLFFIQACQGKLYDRGAHSSLSEKEKKEIQDITQKMDDLQLHQPVEQTDARIPNATRRADFFIAMATSPGFVSWRNTEIGTWFIQAVVYVFKYWAHSHELVNLMTKVNHLVQSAATQYERNKQCPEWRSTLGKSLYFFPGLTSEQLSPPKFHQQGSQQQPMDQTQNSQVIPNPPNM